MLATVPFLVSLAACELPDDVEAARGSLALSPVDAARWRAAPAGCEDVMDTGLVLALCDGEPMLGALVDTDGQVRCVDALGLLVPPTRLDVRLDPRAGDPSPQPNRPPPPFVLDWEADR